MTVQPGAEILKPGYLEPHRLESVGTHYAPATWRDHEGGYVGHANWRDRYGMGTTSGCGHRHRREDSALACIQTKLDAYQPETPAAGDDTRTSGAAQDGRDRGNRCAPSPSPQGSALRSNRNPEG